MCVSCSYGCGICFRKSYVLCQNAGQYFTEIFSLFTTTCHFSFDGICISDQKHIWTRCFTFYHHRGCVPYQYPIYIAQPFFSKELCPTRHCPGRLEMHGLIATSYFIIYELSGGMCTLDNREHIKRYQDWELHVWEMANLSGMGELPSLV